MIPAILSFVFVFYLYRTLNAPEVDNAEVDNDSNAIGTGDEASRRLADLRERIDALTAAVDAKRGDQE